jgi:hypothetical protein
MDHDTDVFLATGSDMPRIRGNRAASVGPDVFDHQRGRPTILNRKVMLYLDALENRGKHIFHLGDHRPGTILSGWFAIFQAGLPDGGGGNGPSGGKQPSDSQGDYKQTLSHIISFKGYVSVSTEQPFKSTPIKQPDTLVKPALGPFEHMGARQRIPSSPPPFDAIHRR